MAYILVFERNTHARTLLTRYLEAEGHIVDIVTTVTILRGILKTRPEPQRHDLILLSHHQSAPQTDTGLAAFEAIRVTPSYKLTPVFGTSYDNYPWKQAAHDPNFAFLPWQIEASDGAPIWDLAELRQNLLQLSL